MLATSGIGGNAPWGKPFLANKKNGGMSGGIEWTVLRSPFASDKRLRLAAPAKQVFRQDDRASRMSSISEKLKWGQPLSGEEMEYLRVNSPELYQKAMLIKSEREQYRRALENCRSKEDVERLRARKMQEFSAQIGAVMRSGMDRGQKEEAIEFIQMRIAAIEDEHRTFLETPAYKRLPRKRRDDMSFSKKPPAAREQAAFYAEV